MGLKRIVLSVGPDEAIRVNGGEEVSQLRHSFIYEGFQDCGFDVGVPFLTVYTAELTELPKQLQESVTRMRRHAGRRIRSRAWFVKGFAIFQHPQIRHGMPPQVHRYAPAQYTAVGRSQASSAIITRCVREVLRILTCRCWSPALKCRS
ncbi:hypothetical protein A5633_14610 [Mycolicibacterium elephantis]|nr:hypothetical protein A5633_14610 [Mycolicibacterium elephantis]